MTDVVPQDIAIDKQIAHSAIEESFDLKVNSIELLGEGWDNLVYRVNDSLIFRFSRRKVALPLLERERRVLMKLASKLILEVPYPQYCSEGTVGYPYPFYGHKEILGQTGCLVSLSDDQYREAAICLAHFLQDLHSVDPNKVIAADDSMSGVFDRAEVTKMLTFFTERLDSIKVFYDLSPFEEKILQIVAKAKHYKPNREKPTFVHGDLYHRHLIFNEKSELTGVIDWGDCCVSDPVVDLAVVFQFFPSSVHEDFFKVYGEISHAAQDYARFLGLYYAVALLWYGHDRKDQRLISTSLESLERV